MYQSISKDPNYIYSSNNYGPFIIIDRIKIEKESRTGFIIKFINTGTITTATYSQVVGGRVKDKYLPIIFNIACIGNETCYHPGYTIWKNMISRCYNINDKNYITYGGVGVRVCNRWLCFEYFANDLPLIDGYDNWVNNKNMYHLDKDYKQQNVPTNKKIYSVDTCCFILNHDNISLSDSKEKLIGLEPIPNNKFRVRPKINGKRTLIGVFDNEIAAANAYNNYMISMFGNNKKVLNNVPYMPPEEVMKYNLKPRKMCTRIK